MNEVKALLVPALLAYVGVRASSMFMGELSRSQAGQVIGGVIGAGAGLFIAKKL